MRWLGMQVPEALPTFFGEVLEWREVGRGSYPKPVTVLVIKNSLQTPPSRDVTSATLLPITPW